MLLLLIFLLILIDVGLRIAITGVDLAFFVGGRVDSIRRKSETAVYLFTKKGKSKQVKATMNMGRKVSRTIDGAVRAGLGTAKMAGKFTAKVGLKIFQTCISLLWKLLLSGGIVVFLVDLIVFLILVVVSYFVTISGII